MPLASARMSIGFICMSIIMTASAMAKLRWRGVSKEKRAEIARKAARAKWAKHKAKSEKQK
jgi:hypothetical protein